MPDQQVCPNCYPAEMEPVSVRGGGRIGWFCHGCTSFVPDGDYIDVLPPSAEAPL